MLIRFVLCVLFVGFSLQNPYIPAGSPTDENYCQAGLETDSEVARINQRLSDGYTLVQVQILTRHGDRAPIEYLHSPVYNDTAIWNCQINRLSHENFNNTYHTQNRLTSERFMPGRQANKGNCGMGSLTQQGANQHQRNGEKFREMYIEAAQLLPQGWDNEQVYVRSGNELRLIESAQSIFVGMYPPQNGNTNEQRQFIDLIDGDFDNMTPDIVNVCPLAKKLRRKAEERQEYLDYKQQRNQLSLQLEDIFEIDYVSVSGMADLIRCRSCHDFDTTYGGLLSQQLIDQILELDLFDFVYFPNRTYENRYGMGSFVQEMVDYFEGYIAGKNPYKFLLFSGHDSSVWPLLDTLNIYDGVWPPLASQVVFEIWQDSSNQYYVEIIYNGRKLTQYVPHCGGGDLCTWQNFLFSTREVRVGLDEFWKECYGFTNVPENRTRF